MNEDKNEWSYTSAPPIRLHGMDSDKLPFTFMFNIGTLHRRVRSAQCDSNSLIETARVCRCPLVREVAAYGKKIKTKC